MDAKLAKKLSGAAKSVVRESMRSGALDRNELTIGEARRLVALKLGLAEDALDGAKDTRKQVKEAITEAIDSYDEDKDTSDDAESPVKATKGKAKRESVAPSSAPSTLAKPAKKSRSRKTADSEDEDEADVPPSPPSSVSSIYDESPPPKKSKAKRVDPDDDGPSPSMSGRKGKRKSDVFSVSNDDDEASPASPASSAMSSVYDEPPKTKRAKAAPKTSKGRTKKDPNEGLSPDEAKLADLKRIVVACGVRKQWTKEFSDYPETRDQIRHVQDILRDLGMKGNPTLGKAKSLKARRELAQELSDVREYEQGHGLSADRPTRTRAGRGTRDSAPPAPDEDGATAAVMDFLGDDSD